MELVGLGPILLSLNVIIVQEHTVVVVAVSDYDPDIVDSILISRISLLWFDGGQ